MRPTTSNRARKHKGNVVRMADFATRRSQRAGRRGCVARWLARLRRWALEPQTRVQALEAASPNLVNAFLGPYG